MSEFDEGLFVIKRVPMPTKAEEPPAPPPGRAKSREGMKLLLTPVDPSLHKRLKLLAVQEDSTIESMVREAIVELLRVREGKG